MKIVKGFRLRDVMGQSIIIGEGVNQVNFNKLITLNPTAAFLWKSIEGKEFDAVKLAEFLVEEYEIDEEVAMRDAKAILEQWTEIGLVK